MPTELVYRRATAADAAAVAGLHADSWRRHYRGVYGDSYLDGPVDADRLAVWTERLAAAERGAATMTIGAFDGGELAGFAHVVLDADPSHGALVDNLHVRHDQQGRGIGRQLMVRAGAHVAATRPASPMFLWVLDANVGAQGFYRAIGGHEADRVPTEPPGGATTIKIRYVWPDPSAVGR